MSETIVLAINVGVPNGPTMSINQTIVVDAYDKFDVVVPDSPTGPTTVNIQLLPSKTGAVKFLMVSSDLYDEKLSYKINSASTVYMLDGPHLLIGGGAVSLLNSVPEKLVLTNGTGKNAQVRILIGRKAA